MNTLTLSTIRQNLSRYDLAGLGLPVLVLLIMAMLVIPLPPLLLDILFTFNIMISLVVIMIAIGTRKPLEFSSFPSVLLFATMLRLALNVASTRVVLVHGHEGPDAAGKVIAAFGEFVIGGNYVVGFIIFVILMIVNFFVVTKGAGRVSEVNARFTLDAMPGKQMSIDADLNAGVIDQETAKKRREELAQESDFFGSMDGASKFVSGDAIAGLLILIINIVGGLAIGIGQHNLPVGEATKLYILLTIGDGLVAQIPSLFLSLATAIIVTRVTTSESMTEQASAQFSNVPALFISAGILTIMGLVPGMPHLVFLTLAAAHLPDSAPARAVEHLETLVDETPGAIDAGPESKALGIILTGGYEPRPEVLAAIRHANLFAAIVPEDTYTVASEVHDLLVKTHPADVGKIELIKELVWEHLQMDRFLEVAAEARFD